MKRAEERQPLAGYGARFRKFSEQWIIQTKGRWAGSPLTLDPWERELVDELLLVWPDGERVYREALVGVPRKNGKSTLSGALGLYLLLASNEQGPEIYAAAASRDQARVVFDQARDFIESSPRLRDWLKPQRSAILCKANQGVFRVLSSDAPLQYGLNPSGVIIDELWAHKDPELYFALTTGQLARSNPLVVSITTAGWDRESICYSLYQRGVKLGQEGGIDAMRNAGFLMRWYEAPTVAEIDDVEAWMGANPANWIREEDLQREYERLPESVFRRLHLNQWTESEDAWIKPHEWDRCFGPVLFDRALPTWVCVDVGIRRDSAALTWGQFHGDVLHVGQDILIPDEEGPRFGVADIRARIVALVKDMPGLREIGYDPWSFRESAEIMAEMGLPMMEFPQSPSRMGPASETIYELVKERRLVHDGNPTMRAQVLAAVIAPTDRGGWRISKRKSLERIDGAISLAMTADRAVTMRNTRPPSRRVTFV